MVACNASRTDAATFTQTKDFARAVAQTLAAKYPDFVVDRMSKELRHRRIFVDWSQNDAQKTTVCAYSLRAKNRPFVSMPLTWRTVERIANDGQGNLAFVDASSVLKQVAKDGDLFQPVLTKKQRLTIG